jgi:sugar lactone lactonase YvrE
LISTDDLTTAGVAILRARAIAAKIRALDDGIVTPKGLAWEKAKEMAYAAEALAYHATWMRNELLKRTT